MKKLNVTLDKGSHSSWGIYIGDPIEEYLFGFETKKMALSVRSLVRDVFKAGQLYEFKRSTKNAQRLMRKFGL